MPNAILKLSKIQDWVEHTLGKPQVAIELNVENYRKAILETTAVYNRYRPQRMKTKIAAVSAQKKYPITHHNLQGVVDLDYVRASVVSGRVDPFDPTSVIYNPMSIGGGETFATYAQSLSYQEEARKVVSAEFEWFGQWEVNETDGTSQYYLYIDIPQGITYDVSYLYTWHVDPDNGVWGLQHIANGDVDWYLRFVLACVKESLARVRGKYHGIPMPDGGEEDNDYSELAEESRAAREELINEIKARMPPTMPVIG